MNKEEIEICHEAWKFYGEDDQLDMLVEECAELIQAVNKYKRSRGKDRVAIENALYHLAEEAADVNILLEQVLTGKKLWKQVREWEHMKIGRLRVRIDKARDEFRKKNLEM